MGPDAAGAAGVPSLAEFLRWIDEIPVAFMEEPVGFERGRVSVRAVVRDLLEALLHKVPDAELLDAFDPAGNGLGERNRLRWVLASAHVFWHPALRGATIPEGNLRAFFVQEIAALGAVVSADEVFGDNERREELVRRVLRAANLRLPGENAEVFADRLAQIDSVERQRVVAEAATKEKRAREVREEMARKAAAEAAAKASRE